MWWPFKRRTKRPPADLRTRRGVEYFCATCCASEGERHLEWCHRPGVMRAPR